MHSLKKAQGSLQGVTDARDEFKEKSEELHVELEKTKIDLKEYMHKEKLSSEEAAEATDQC